jgi:hypothetical protein
LRSCVKENTPSKSESVQLVLAPSSPSSSSSLLARRRLRTSHSAATKPKPETF